MTVEPGSRYTITGAPRVVKGKVIIGNGGAEMGVRGYVTAYDAETGRQLWRFYTVPGDPVEAVREPGARRWPRRPGPASGGSTAAAAPSGTRWPTIRSSTCSTSAPATARRGTARSAVPGGGDNLFLSSIVALKARDRRIRLALPDDARRDLGLHRHPAHDPRRPRDRRPRPQGDHAGAEERLLLRARPRDRRADLGRAPSRR